MPGKRPHVYTFPLDQLEKQYTGSEMEVRCTEDECDKGPHRTNNSTWVASWGKRHTAMTGHATQITRKTVYYWALREEEETDG